MKDRRNIKHNASLYQLKEKNSVLNKWNNQGISFIDSKEIYSVYSYIILVI